MLFICTFSTCCARQLFAQPENKTLVWSDEFNYIGLPDAARWDYSTVGNLFQWGNHELQHYTREEAKNSFVALGRLAIKAVKEGERITSARLQTKTSGNWQHARVEVRAKMASGRGLCSAIWLLPSSWDFSQGRSDGEIDIAEYVGFSKDSIYHTVHASACDSDVHSYSSVASFVSRSEQDYHIYAVEWDDERVDFFVDGRLTHSYKRAEHPQLRWAFDESYYLILNVSVGGNWAAMHGIDYDCFPAKMLVDYVRIYEL